MLNNFKCLAKASGRDVAIALIALPIAAGLATLASPAAHAGGLLGGVVGSAHRNSPDHYGDLLVESFVRAGLIDSAAELATPVLPAPSHQ